MTLLTAIGANALGVVLLASGLLKLARPMSGTLGISLPGRPLAGARSTLALGVGEAIVGGSTIALLAPGEWAAVALTGGFVAWTAWALARGRAGQPCPCFAGLTVVGRSALVRALALAALAVAVAIAPWSPPSAVARVGLAAATLAILCAFLAWLSFTLAREVARLRSGLTRPGALEIPDEGPPVGQPSPLVERFRRSEPLLLAVFVSPGCRLCGELAPAIALLAARPGLELEVLDEERDVLAWRAASVPGSPYAVAMDASGVVLAKGTFNTPAQLESVPATGLRRRRELAGVGAWPAVGSAVGV